MKADDSLLHYSMKLFKLNPVFLWKAGEYIWPVDHTVDFSREDIAGMQGKLISRMPLNRADMPSIRTIQPLLWCAGDVPKSSIASGR
jgi:hypothetical protein